MDPLRAICHELGFFTREHAREAGYDGRAITREARANRWTRIRRGYYTFPDIWQTSTDEERHLMRCRAVLDSHGDNVALSHTSGCLALGIDVWGLDLSRVHVTRLDGGAGRIEGDVVHHEGFVASGEVGTVNGMRVLGPARCTLEAGSVGTPECALVLLNSALYRGLCTDADIANQFDLMAHWPRVRHLHIPVRMCTRQSESVGESRGLWFFWVQHLPAPELQYEVFADGRLLGRTDWAWPRYRGLGEFDGKVKYGSLLKPGQTPGDAVFEEKRREDLLREATQSWMIRLIWSDFDRPSQTAQRFRQKFAAAS
ncbi:type IV toxin-antitoxin system AbiEi family antitoxin domain-containing protein [Nocardioides sp.]|uniref:type IV toxin-antitoxin system AbiEi family antitoxin domain-containing protein n=1 Tax=Nocardioides sp. TaxID=35761 RepID=UPI002C80B242|nr:type IV toxin-antitoxin system AbiEi family antitoxin domain-containing protein [Nocardioides sp.]HXH78267.1 type IV toxin-antitoxin system AbiEi family antitoxin domain-containing protein [Nocardioides sp.]